MFSLCLTLFLQLLLVQGDVRLNETCSCDLKRSYEWNCGKYYECAVSQLFIRDCPPGLHFNEQLQQCVYPAQSSCNEDSICEANATTTTMTTTPTTTGTTLTTYSTTSEPSQDCDTMHGCFYKACSLFEDVLALDKCRSEVLLREKKNWKYVSLSTHFIRDSSEYYWCVEENCYCRRHCKDGLVFDPKAEDGYDPALGFCTPPSTVPECVNHFWTMLIIEVC